MSAFEGTSTDELLEVRLEAFPVQVWERAREHADELIRELALIAAGSEEGSDHHGERGVPQRLGELIDRLTDQYGSLTVEQERQLADAAEAGIEALDVLTFRVPPAARPAVAQLMAMFEEADRYCLAGDHLLTLATPPELVRFRMWYLDEFARQLAGSRPRPWPDYSG